MRGSSFFEGIRQVDLDIAGRPGRAPTFYYDCRSITAVFPARYAALRRLMPDRRFVPARLAPGLGLVAISALEYRDTDVGPYNEMLIGAVLSDAGAGINYPGRALVDATLRPDRADLFITHLPVTTEPALRGGIDYYNYPKFLASIEFADGPGPLSCRLAEGQEHVLTLSGRPLATPDSRDADYFCHSFMDGQPQCGQFRLRMAQTATCRRPGAATVTLGMRHPIALELERLLVSRSSLTYELTPRMEGILFGPEHWTLPLAVRALEAAGAVERGAVVAHPGR